MLAVTAGPVNVDLKRDASSSYNDFQVYNRGPQILDEHKAKLFQLGYQPEKLAIIMAKVQVYFLLIKLRKVMKGFYYWKM